MAIYAIGEGWTGALTQRYARDSIGGHFDEETFDEPVMIYPHDDILHADAGWGCSAFLNTQGQVQLVGRPQDLMALLRMNRMPAFMRQWVSSNSDPSQTNILGRIVSKLIEVGTGGGDRELWEAARELSLLHDWTKVDLNVNGVGDSSMSKIYCSAGFMAMIGKSGTLYTLGINSRGQCGTGELSNNEWIPAQVQGISLSENKGKDNLGQDQPVIQVALGFQHGFALTKLGQVFSWGKGMRGQLGRELRSDQDSIAKLIKTDFPVVKIASGNHHGALLDANNKVYIWGKNMGRGSSESGDEKPTDAPVPEMLEGLPLDHKVLDVTCGSHHTSILLEDGSVYAIGIASDEATPLLDPVQLVQPGLLELPLRQFKAHQDRTTLVDNHGRVFQVHLWKNESLRDYAMFTPPYVETLLDEGQSIKEIHRGWLHTIIVTQPK